MVRAESLDKLYRTIRPAVFASNPTIAHKAVMALMHFSGGNPAMLSLLKGVSTPSHEELAQTVDGVKYDTPIVLASGFLKEVDNAIVKVMRMLGFAVLELGSFTYYPWPGNPGQTLWRLPQDEALINWQELPGKGSFVARSALKNADLNYPVGVSAAAMPQNKEGDDELEVFARTLEMFMDLPVVAYEVVNIGCPNHQYGTTYAQDLVLLRSFMQRIAEVIKRKPTYLKVPGDVTHEQLEVIVEIALEYNCAGLVVANTSLRREGLLSQNLLDKYGIRDKGGLSGRPLFSQTCQLVSRAFQASGGKLTIMGSGGVFTAEDAFTLTKSGATMVQILTALIYRGPWVAAEINNGLVQLLREEGYTNISESVGTVHW